jgi:dihydrofolate reductase
VRSLFAFEFVTADGLFEGASPWSLDWHNVDAEFNDHAVRQLEASDTLLFGRRTYEGMAGYWPTEAARTDDPVVARLMNDTPKVVFSASLERVGWENTRLCRDGAGDEVRRLKALPGKEIAILGSSDLTASLVGLGLVDEIRLMVNPVLLGAGRRVFDGLGRSLRLRLLRTQTFRSGNVLLCYGVGS